MSLLISIVGGFTSGVFLRSLFFLDWASVIFFVFLAIIFLTALFLVPRRIYLFGTLFFFSILFGIMRTSFSENVAPQVWSRQLTHRVSYEGSVTGDPHVSDTKQRVPVRISSGKSSTTVLVVTRRYPELSVGDRVFVSGTLELPESFTGDNGRTFRYDKYLEKDGVHFILNFASVSIEQQAPWYSLSAFLARIKHSFLRGLEATLPEPYASLAGGIVIGGKSGLGTKLQDAFVRSGLVQIIVLSGYNVMVVAEWVMAAFSFARLSRRVSAVAGAVALLIFIGIAGASATSIRAAFMAIIALYARATGHTYTAGRALLVTVFIMLLWNPLYLGFDPGFTLSVVATAGLIWLSPKIENIMERISQAHYLKKIVNICRTGTGQTNAYNITVLQKTNFSYKAPATFGYAGFWKNAIATTLSAQIAVLPLLLYFTGNLSFVSIPANLLVMPMVPLAMGFSALAGIAGMIISPISQIAGIIFGFPAYLSMSYLIAVARESAALPWAARIIPTFPFIFVLLAYAGLVWLATAKRFSTTPQLRLSKNAST